MSEKLPLWNRAASIENETAGATNTAPASNMTSTKSLTCQRTDIGKEATNRPSMNCLGEMRLLTMLRGLTPEAICLWMTQGWFRMSPGGTAAGCGAARTKTHQ